MMIPLSFDFSFRQRPRFLFRARPPPSGLLGHMPERVSKRDPF